MTFDQMSRIVRLGDNPDFREIMNLLSLRVKEFEEAVLDATSDSEERRAVSDWKAFRRAISFIESTIALARHGIDSTLEAVGGGNAQTNPLVPLMPQSDADMEQFAEFMRNHPAAKPFDFDNLPK